MATIKDGDVKSAAELLGDGNVKVDIFYTKPKGGIDKVVGKRIVITGFEERTSSYKNGPGKFYTITAEAKVNKKDKTIGFNCGSIPLMRELDQLKEHFPVPAVIREVAVPGGRYYTMMDKNNKKSDN